MAKKVCLGTDACISVIKGEPKSEKLSDLIVSDYEKNKKTKFFGME